MWRISLFLVLAACSPRIPQPWYAEVIPGVRPTVAKYDADGLLHVLSYGDDNALHYGTLDPNGADRSVTDDGPLLRDGQPFDTAGLWTDLAFRPNGEVWAWIGGAVGVIDGTNFDERLFLESPTSEYFGAVAFEGDDRLHTGVAGGSWVAYDVSGDGPLADGEGVTGMYLDPEFDDPSLAYEVAIGAPCRLWIDDGIAWARYCETNTTMRSVDVLDLTTREMHVGAGYSGALAYADGAVWVDYGCVIETNADDSWTSDAADDHIPIHDGDCDGYDYLHVLPGESAVDLRNDHTSVAYATYNSALVIADEKRPRDFVSDKTGTWCRDAIDGQQTFSLLEDGTYVPPLMPYFYGYGQPEGSELLYGTKRWRQSGDQLHIELSDPISDTMGIDASDAMSHWAVRVGDTLNIRTGLDKAGASHVTDSGYVALTGQWTLCN